MRAKGREKTTTCPFEQFELNSVLKKKKEKKRNPQI